MTIHWNEVVFLTKRAQNAVAILLLLIGATFFYFFRGDYSITLSFANDILSVDGPQGMLFTTEFQNIASVALMDESFDHGEKISGDERYGYVFGEYVNAELGRYELCTRKKVNRFMVVSTLDGRTVVFNTENNETMENLYSAILELLQTEGYHIAAP